MDKDTANRLRATKAQAVGKTFEEIVDDALDRQKVNRMLLHSAHREAGYRLVKKKWMPVAAVGADFGGVFFGGLPLALEAKTESTERFYKSRISAKQLAELDAVEAAGAVAALAISFAAQGDGDPRHFVIPWRLVPWSTAKSAEGLVRSDVNDVYRMVHTDPFHWVPSCRNMNAHPRRILLNRFAKFCQFCGTPVADNVSEKQQT